MVKDTQLNWRMKVPKTFSDKHRFIDSKGNTIQQATIAAALGVTDQTAINRLDKEKVPPHDFHKWLLEQFKRYNSDSFVSEEDDTSKLKHRQLVAEVELKEGKAREQSFKNEISEGKYILVEDAQRTIDNILITLKTNLYGIPDQVAASMITSREVIEAKNILKEALEHHMETISQIEIKVGEDEEELDDANIALQDV